jgi:hypothetical protein
MRKNALVIAIAVILTLSTLLTFQVNPVHAVTPSVEVMNPDTTHTKAGIDPTYWNASNTYDTKHDGSAAGPHDLVFHTDTVTGNMFYVDVWCNNIVDLWNWQINFSWDPTVLAVIFDQSPGGIMPFCPLTSIFHFDFTPGPIVDNVTGSMLFGYTQVSHGGKTGSDILARIPMLIINGVGYLGWNNSTLTIEEPGTNLYDHLMHLITPRTLVGGYYEQFWVIPPAPSLYVSPVNYTASTLGEDVKINVMVKDVNPAWEIIGFQFILDFNESLLSPGFGMTEYDPGTFLETQIHGTESVMYFVSHGYEGDAALPAGFDAFVVGVLMLPGGGGYSAPWPSGGGTLVTLHFTAILQTISPAIAYTDLNFTYIENVPGFPSDNINPYALNHYGTKISYATQTNGGYIAPMKVLGLALDLYSQYPRPYGGQDWGKPSDSFAPQQQIELYAKLTYNADPVQQKLVGFHLVHGEFDIYREATTDANGIAHVSVRLPWPCIDPIGRVLGLWYARATAEVAEMVANDTMPFYVWWDVEVVSIEPKVTQYFKHKPTGADPLTFTMEYRTYKMQPVPVNLTATVYDELGFFIGGDVHEIKAFGWGGYGHFGVFYTGTWDISIPMPTNAMVGECRVYGNAFNNLPWDYGTPYCPEVTNTIRFWIVKT